MDTTTRQDTAEMLLQDALHWAQKAIQEHEQRERQIQEGRIQRARQFMWKQVPKSIWEALGVTPDEAVVEGACLMIPIVVGDIQAKITAALPMLPRAAVPVCYRYGTSVVVNADGTVDAFYQFLVRAYHSEQKRRAEELSGRLREADVLDPTVRRELKQAMAELLPEDVPVLRKRLADKIRLARRKQRSLRLARRLQEDVRAYQEEVLEPYREACRRYVEQWAERLYRPVEMWEITFIPVGIVDLGLVELEHTMVILDDPAKLGELPWRVHEVLTSGDVAKDVVVFSVVDARPVSMPEEHPMERPLEYYQTLKVGPYFLNIPVTERWPDEPPPSFKEIVTLNDWLTSRGWDGDEVVQRTVTWTEGQADVVGAILEVQPEAIPWVLEVWRGGA